MTRLQLRRAIVGVLVLLLLQYLLGIAVNLFVTIPTNHPGARPPEYFGGVVQSVTWAVSHGPLLLILHASLGLLLVVGAASLVVRAWPSAGRMIRWTTGVGAVSVLAAGFNGGSFLNYNEDFSSMIMASFFAIAVGSYVLALSALAVPEAAVSPA